MALRATFNRANAQNRAARWWRSRDLNQPNLVGLHSSGIVCRVVIKKQQKQEAAAKKMAKRRRRINASLFALLLLNLLLLLLLVVEVSSHYQHSHLSQEQNHHQHQHHHQHHQHQVSVKGLISSNSESQQQAVSSTGQLCALLGDVAKHLKLCKLIRRSRNADEAVALGASKGLAECRNQFRSERWNCTHAHGEHHLLTGELAQSVGNRESGFVHAIAAAGIVHSIATACSVGNLTDCACDKTRMGLIRLQEENWKWGGCSNNIKHGMLYAKHLVELLDAVHQRQVAASEHHHHEHQEHQHHRLARRSPVESVRVPAALVESAAFCQKNQNLSQETHKQLIKSLLAKNSLEKHQEFRLAMNMHNNKVGRMVSQPSRSLCDLNLVLHLPKQKPHTNNKASES